MLLGHVDLIEKLLVLDFSGKALSPKSVVDMLGQFPLGRGTLKELKGLKKRFKHCLEQLSAREKELQRMSEGLCASCDKLGEHFRMRLEDVALMDEISSLTARMDDANLEKNEEFRSKVRVLQQLGFIDKGNEISQKGRFSREISSGDQILLTEFLFNYEWSSLSDPEFAGIVAVFLQTGRGKGGKQQEAGLEEEQERLGAEESIMGKACTEAREFILGITEKLLALERREGVKEEVNEVEGRLNY